MRGEHVLRLRRMHRDLLAMRESYEPSSDERGVLDFLAAAVESAVVGMGGSVATPTLDYGHDETG